MNKYYTPQFRQEAVRQVNERGYSVADVAKRHGVSQQSIYKWINALSPNKDGEIAAELSAIKRENIRLKTELENSWEEIDILKLATAHFAKVPRVKYAFIFKYYRIHSVQRMCRLLGVSRSGYYRWTGQLYSKRSL